MKSGIHPEYRPVVFVDAVTGAEFPTRSTINGVQERTEEGRIRREYRLPVSSDSHPFWKGGRSPVSAEGRIARFRRKYPSSINAPSAKS